MSAKEESRLDRLGMIAGGGTIPQLLYHAASAQGHNPFVVTLKDAAEFDGDITLPFSKAEAIVKALKGAGVRDLVVIGSMARPKLKDLGFDLKTLRFFARVGINALGDNGLLVALREELERDGFRLRGAHEYLTEMVTPAGQIGAHIPLNMDDVSLGVEASQEWGKADMGQAVIVLNGEIVAREDRGGTDAMIQSYNGSPGAILVKTCKPQQDRAFDLPTIGLQTVQNCVEKDFSGIVIHAGASFFLDREMAIALADQHNMFLWGGDI